jgi:PAS domain S-box-containing protein
VLRLLAGLFAVTGMILAALAVYVSRRRGSPSGLSLAVLLVAVAWWGMAYAIELSATDFGAKDLWGVLKYAGVAAVAPAWLVFVLQYTGRGRLVTRRLLLVLAIEPLAVMAVLANPQTQALIRYYVVATGDELPVVGTGPLFWVHFAYINLMILFATALFVVSMVRVSRLYWRLAAVLVAATLLPWTLNFLHNLSVGPFTRIDLTPFGFVVTGAVLVWGLFRERLVNLAPVARGVIVETMADAVLVLDAFRRVVDANPAAAAILGRDRTDMVGRPLADLMPRHPAVAPRNARVGSDGAQVELTLPVQGRLRHFDARRQPLPDRSGAAAGEIVVLRDITERMQAESRLRDLLAERTRVAAALQGSLLPASLPAVPGTRLAARYHPAGDGREIGGDFYDVFPVSPCEWAVVLGDVSGKGAEAAAVTALVRYTLRTLAAERRPPRSVLDALNDALLRQGSDERYCTLVYCVARPTEAGLRLSVTLAGHHPPLVRRADGSVREVGRLGTALGLVQHAETEPVTVDLGPGDLLCLFTDGVVEARSRRDLFGVDRLSDVLAREGGQDPEQVVSAVERAARSFSGGPLADDVAVLTLSVPLVTAADGLPDVGPAATGTRTPPG